ncbi:MAG TPA: type IV pilus modification protein PilV [Thiotrichales bacterium]|nr:type IV pilus modification protein PilV [Thiotrichales bacterium]
MLLSTCKARGFTMMELLVSILVLSVGLLGLASLQTTGLRHNASAWQRTLATELAADMADRIRANSLGANKGNYDNIQPGAHTDCLTQNGGCATPAAVADADAAQWFAALANRLPGGTGSVTGTAIAGGDARRFTIRVMWDDERRGVTGRNCSGNPAVDLTCFTMQFIH